MTESRSDRELWLLVRAGDEQVFGLLFRRHARAIYNYCFRRLGSWAAAEDLTSVVFLEAWRRRATLAPYGDTALPLLYGIALRVTRNHRRAVRRYRAALDRMPPPRDTPDPAADVDDRIDALRQMTRVREALDRISRRDREVIELCSWTDMTQEEVAAALGVPLGTVKSRLFRARRELANHLDVAKTRSTSVKES